MKQKSKPHIILDKETHQRLKSYCNEHGMKLNHTGNRILAAWLERIYNPNKKYKHGDIVYVRQPSIDSATNVSPKGKE